GDGYGQLADHRVELLAPDVVAEFGAECVPDPSPPGPQGESGPETAGRLDHSVEAEPADGRYGASLDDRRAEAFVGFGIGVPLHESHLESRPPEEGSRGAPRQAAPHDRHVVPRSGHT